MSSFLPRLGLRGIGGIGQMTPAGATAVAKATRTGQTRMMGSAKRKRGKKKAASAGGAKKKRKSKGKSRLVKGSAAAKAYMAKIRRKKKK